MSKFISDIELKKFDSVYFIGIGGIGMSSLARYFKQIGWHVEGYDKTPSALTDQLQQEGISIHFEDLAEQIPEAFNNTDKSLVVYTPAIPESFGELVYFKSIDANVLKRSEVLGLLTLETKGLCVAGTHGKTTTSSMLAHILNNSHVGCNAFLGGIASNFGSNILINKDSDYTVVEADEFDRSFLNLKPFAAIITSIDPDHLDIYENQQSFKEGFQQFAKLISSEGCLVIREGIILDSPSKQISYAIDSETSDYQGYQLRYEQCTFVMDVKTPRNRYNSVELAIPGIHNAENALACIALAEFVGCSEQEIRNGLRTFKGVKRRFEYHVKTEKLIYIDDYAHHPTEIQALIKSVRLLYPGKKITAAFQPHLYSRTRDFFNEFVLELSKVDELVLLPIYPARELPIPGVNSNHLLDQLPLKSKVILSANQALTYLSTIEEGVILTIGAGDIDRIVEPLSKALS